MAASVVAMSFVACASLTGLSGGSGPGDGGIDGSAPEASAADGSIASSEDAGSIESACAHAAEAFCNRLAVCDPASVQILFGGPSTCAAQGTQICVIEAASPGSGATPGGIAACGEAMLAQSCIDRLDGKAPAACRYTGAREEGESCIGDAQCKTGHCAGLSGSGCGTCRVPANVGAACGSGCAPGLRCIGGVCSEPRRENETCESNDDCSRALQCNAGKCVPWLHENQQCAPEVQASLACDPTKLLACTGEPKTCVKLPVFQPGADCTSANGLPAICAGGLCTGAPDATPRCVAWAGPGEPCTDRACDLSLWCVAGECVVPSQSLCAN